MKTFAIVLCAMKVASSTVMTSGQQLQMQQQPDATTMSIGGHGMIRTGEQDDDDNFDGRNGGGGYGGGGYRRLAGKTDDEPEAAQAKHNEQWWCRPGHWNWPRCCCHPGSWNWPRCRWNY